MNERVRPVELRDHALAERWLEAGTALRRTTPVFDAAAAGAWITAAITEADSLPPPGVVLDLAALLSGGKLDPHAPAPPDAALARALATYEHQFLGRLAADSRLALAADAVTRLPKALRATAVGVTLATLLHRARPAHTVSLPPGTARRFAQRAAEPEDPFAALRDDAAVRNLLTQGYDGLVVAAQRTRTLLGEGDVFTLEHLAVLESLAQRIALEDVLVARAALLEGVPRRLRRKVRPRGAISARAEEEDTYPVGGFSALSTVGSLENLVTSELVYLEDHGEIDLFDVRFAQGELLYYTRDEATLLRTHRFVSFVLEASLVDARCKDPGVPVQRIVLLLAALHALVVRLVEELGHEDLRIRLVFPEGPALAPERSLASVLFLEQIERGVVEVVNGELATEIELAADAAGRGLAQVIRCGTDPTPAAVPRAIESFALPAERASVAEVRARMLALLHALP